MLSESVRYEIISNIFDCGKFIEIRTTGTFDTSTFHTHVSRRIREKTKECSSLSSKWKIICSLTTFIKHFLFFRFVERQQRKQITTSVKLVKILQVFGNLTHLTTFFFRIFWILCQAFNQLNISDVFDIISVEQKIFPKCNFENSGSFVFFSFLSNNKSDS